MPEPRRRLDHDHPARREVSEGPIGVGTRVRTERQGSAISRGAMSRSESRCCFRPDAGARREPDASTCRRSRVRIPSAALGKARLPRGSFVPERGAAARLVSPLARCDRVRRVGVAGGRKRRPGRSKSLDPLRRWRDRRHTRGRRRPAGGATRRNRSARRARLLRRARADQRPHPHGDDAVPRPGR